MAGPTGLMAENPSQQILRRQRLRDPRCGRSGDGRSRAPEQHGPFPRTSTDRSGAAPHRSRLGPHPIPMRALPSHPVHQGADRLQHFINRLGQILMFMPTGSNHHAETSPLFHPIQSGGLRILPHCVMTGRLLVSWSRNGWPTPTIWNDWPSFSPTNDNWRSSTTHGHADLWDRPRPPRWQPCCGRPGRPLQNWATEPRSCARRKRAETHSARYRNSASAPRSAQFPARIDHGS